LSAFVFLISAPCIAGRRETSTHIISAYNRFRRLFLQYKCALRTETGGHPATYERSAQLELKGEIMLEGLVTKLADTPWSIALHESLYMYAITESTHVMSIMLFVGTIAMIDLRLLGVSYRSVPVTQMLSRMLPWTIAGFVLLVITGGMLFLAIPIRTYHSLWFRLKCLMILIAAINIAIFTFRVEHDKAKWDLGAVPRKSKICAVISLSAWACVVVFGRLIAYNWFDCDSITSVTLSELTGCTLDQG
jgi:uncharacterized membrane protein